ncbi:MAG: TonB family protein, partial [Sulfurovaceae bacterium]|nr:TonB family protein [Sulfurovaceae bacterium]
PIVEEFYEEPIIQEVYTQAVVEEIYEEPMVEVYQAPVVHAPAPMQQAVVTTAPIAPPAPQVDLEGTKRIFLDGVRATIHTNKKYPKMAKRRNIQGMVHVVFDIQSDGTATNIQTSGGASILQKAVRKSIERSFPLSIPLELMGKFPMMGVSVNVDFVLE